MKNKTTDNGAGWATAIGISEYVLSQALRIGFFHLAMCIEISSMPFCGLIALIFLFFLSFFSAELCSMVERYLWLIYTFPTEQHLGCFPGLQL
jgi:hypothetical protein